MKVANFMLYLACMVSLSATAQEATFSKRFSFGFPASIFSSVVVVDTNYYITGVIADSIPPNKKGNIFVQFNRSGEAQSVKTLRSATKTYEIWRGNMLQCLDENFLACGLTFEQGNAKSLLIKYSPQGDTLFTREYPNFFNDTLYTRAEDIALSNEGGFIMATQNRKEAAVNHNEFGVLKLDSLGNVQWHRVYGSPNYSDNARSVLAVGDRYLVGGNYNDGHISREDITFRTQVISLDADGELEWRYLSPTGELQIGANDMVATPDGGILVVSGSGVEVPAGPGFGQLRWHNYAYKLDSSRQVEWGVVVRDSLPAIMGNNHLSAGILVNNGYAMAGNLIARTPENWFFSGVLAKVSFNGELLWKRYYQHIPEEGPRHYIYDLAQASDGSFILVGEVWEPGTTPSQQGWLLKVDEYGCLVPGCEVVQSAEDSKSPADLPQLLLYPNPVSEELQVYFSAPAGDEYHFRILDTQGREWRRFSTRLSEVTLLVEVGELPGGVYYLQCLREGKVVRVEGFVKR
ncbi:MAG: T9SS type A sorting domain-containing protein [Lewinellaceae bacterium]|nr:T9SS type A sorting domain-containing protein [Lewinellaceae bacterium]